MKVTIKQLKTGAWCWEHDGAACGPFDTFLDACRSFYESKLKELE